MNLETLALEISETLDKPSERQSWLADLSKQQRAAVIIWDFNCQVLNGGFLQWEQNGYSDDAPALQGYLAAINTETAQALNQVLNEFLGLARANPEEIQDDDFEYLDQAYWHISDKFVAEVNEWLKYV